ncbi:glycosyltransferase family 2 protein [Alphaproteobacteria bacterium]|nr:glycosyltransferase family 2 protein [Alphaproteobacteria bacterium]
MPLKNKKKLSILIPVYNEINFLELFTNKLVSVFKNTNTEYIFIDDGSTDGSKEWLVNYLNKSLLDVQLIDLKKNYGKGYALHEGIKIAKGDYLLFQDADLELDPNDSLEMFNIILNDQSINCVFGSRYLSGKLKKNKNYLNEFIGKMNSLIFNFLFQESLSDIHCGTKIVSKKILDNLKLTIKDFGFEIDIAAQISKLNYDIYEYGISYFARSKIQGKKITWIDGLKSYYYLFKTRFIQNDLATIYSILYSTLYMGFIGTYFGMGIGKYLVVISFIFVGLFIGLHRRLFSSTTILFFSYIGSLFSQGNGKIYTILIGFLFGIYISKMLIKFIRGNTQNKLITFFI